MEDQPATEPTTTTATPERSKSPWRLIAAAGVGVLVIAAIAGAVAIASDDDAPDYAASQIGRMRQGCQQWVDSIRGEGGPDSAWCDSMAGWMDGRMGDDSTMGEGQMRGSMMWRSPADMRTTCEQWMADNPDAAPAGADRSTWCGQMVDWMDRHLGGWDGWMSNGPMTGNP
jgi:hypothetical protein